MSGLFDQVVNYSPPLLTSGQVNYDGTWNAATNTPTLVSPPDALSKGDYYVVSAAGTQFGISFAVGDWIISNGTAWEKVDLTDAVSSVFGRTGAVVGDSTDYSAVGLTNTAIGAANPSTGAFTSLSSSSTTTLNGTTIPASKTLVVTTDKLSALAATTSAELAGVISDETGSGSLVFANSPTLVSPALGTSSALVGTNITGTAAAFNINGTVGATTPSTVAATSVTALSDSGYQAVVGQLTSGDRVGISGQASGSGTALVFFDNAQTTFRPAIFDASSHSLKISGVEKASVTSTGLQGAIGATTPSTGAFTSLSSTSGAFNGTVGATTPSTVTGTTLTANGGNVVIRSGYALNLNNPANDSTAQIYNNAGGGSNEVRFLVGGADRALVTSTGLNSTAIGATTPSTGAFTTLSATGNLTLSAANSNILGGTSTGSSSIYNSTGAAGFTIYGPTHATKANQIDVFAGGLGHTFNSTGLAVTGALSASNTVSQDFNGAGGNSFTARYNSSNPRGGVYVQGGSGKVFFGENLVHSTANVFVADKAGTAWALADSGGSNVGLFYATGLTAGATAFDFSTTTGRILSVSSTGLAVTGALSSDSLVKIGGTVNGNSGLQFDVSRSLAGVEWFGSVSGAGYGHRAIEDDSGAGFSRFKLQGRVNSASWTTVLQIDGTTGVAVTGALSATGALAIGNTVNTVSPTSPNRTVTIVIGGTTYYLAAKTTND